MTVSLHFGFLAHSEIMRSIWYKVKVNRRT